MRNRRNRPAGNAVEEQSQSPTVRMSRRHIMGVAAALPLMPRRSRLGELPEDLMSDRAIRQPMFSPAIRDFAPGQAPVIGPPSSNMPSAAPWMNPYKFVTYPLAATSAGAQKIVTANLRRTYLLIQNKDAAEVYANFGTNPTVDNSFTISGGGSLEFIGGSDGGAFCPVEDVYILGSAVDQIVVAGEGYRLTY